jgi:hypothetical protein
MDSNVSKNTFFYKFFKLPPNPVNLSLKELLKHYLWETIELLKEQNNLDIDLNNLSKTIANKIILSQKLSTQKNLSVSLARLKLSGIVYRCAVAFPVAAACQLPPEIMAAQLVQLLPSKPSKSVDSIDLKFAVRVQSSGWIDFYLSNEATALWLEKATSIFPQQPELSTCLKIDRDFFFLHYVYARCIALLRLAARERLITLKDENFNDLAWCIATPSPILWLDENLEILLTHPSERRLLTQLLTANDILTIDEPQQWLKISYSLGEVMLSFDADCRIWGEVLQQTPEKSIARLGLIALVQFWLQNFFITKLGIRSIKEL